MKPNSNQIKAIDAILGCIEHWKVTNDINSPSHWNLIDEDFRDFEEDFQLTQSRVDALKDHIGDILFFVRHIK